MRNFFAFVLFLLGIGVSAQNTPKNIYGALRHGITGEILLDAECLLLTTDSIPLDTMWIGHRDGQISQTVKPWRFSVPNEAANYIIRFSKEGFATKYLDVSFHPGGRRINYDFGTVRLFPAREVHLGAAEVKATQVKFFHKGDTLVFNASAFQLPEGSMLDALVRQLPGAELRDDGGIYVNGHHVESLLLNGKDFFNNKQELMLDNLPSYTVKHIKVYEKQGEFSEFVGRRTGDEEYVMDVELKKEYSTGWLANIDAGAGTSSRYMARLFAMRFTNQSRISLYANMNNLNETRKPGQDGNWTPEALQQGMNRPTTVGVDYFVDDYRERFRVNGNAQVEHVDRDNTYRMLGERFLSSGNTFSAKWYRQYSHNVSLSTWHNWRIKRKLVQATLQPYVYYTRWDNRRDMVSATFSVKPEDWEHVIDSIRRPSLGSTLAAITMNKDDYNMVEHGHQTTMKLASEAYIKFKRNDDQLSMDGHIAYNDYYRQLFDQELLTYPQSGAPQEFFNRYKCNKPNRSTTYEFHAEYYYWLDLHSAIVPFYRLSGEDAHKDYALYRLEQLAGFGEGSDMGLLPSENELLSTIDRGNSYTNRNSWQTHTMGVRFSSQDYIYRNGEQKGYYDCYVNIPIQLKHERMDYARSVVDTLMSHRYVFFNPNVHMEYSWHDWQRHASLVYSVSHSTPSMVSRLTDIVDDADPLDITLGNSGLKNTTRHSLNLSYRNNSSRKQRTFNAGLAYNAMRNLLAYATYYNPVNGVLTSKPVNVNGNWNTSANVNYAMPLDRPRRLTFSTGTSAGYRHSVDMTSTTPDMYDERSLVRTVSLTEQLRLTYKHKRFTVGLKCRGAWYHATGDREGFSTVNATDFSYGILGTLSLPWDMQLSTDLTMYSRRGYGDAGANTDDLVWNARLTKTMLKGRLAIMLDGFDILGNLSSYNYSINAQGITETWRNSVPSYAMLHVAYRFNLQPKKRN